MTTDTDPVPDQVLTEAMDLGVQLAQARRDYAALRCPLPDGNWATYWAALGAAEGHVADLYARFAALDPTDSESAEQAALYRNRANDSAERMAEAAANQPLTGDLDDKPETAEADAEVTA